MGVPSQVAHPAAGSRRRDRVRVPGDLRDGMIYVVQEDLCHPRTSARSLGAEISQPTIVRTQAGPAEFVGVRDRGPCQQIAGWKEGRNGVREEDLRDDAIILELA